MECQELGSSILFCTYWTDSGQSYFNRGRWRNLISIRCFIACIMSIWGCCDTLQFSDIRYLYSENSCVSIDFNEYCIRFSYSFWTGFLWMDLSFRNSARMDRKIGQEIIQEQIQSFCTNKMG